MEGLVMQMKFWMFERILQDHPADFIKERDYMTLISLDNFGTDEYQERKDNFKKDIKSFFEQKISNVIFLTAFHLAYKFGEKGKGVSFFNDLQGKTKNLISRLVYEKLE